MSGEGDILSGAADGAVAGYSVGGVYGAIAGGIVGAIGGLFSRKAKKQKKRARKEQMLMAERDQAIQRRELVRQFRLARAQALASGSADSGGGGSAVQGAVSSIATQGAFNINFFDTQAASQLFIEKTLGKAERNMEISGAISGLIGSVGNAGNSGMFGGSKKEKESDSGSSDPPTAMQSKQSFNYGTTPVLG